MYTVVLVVNLLICVTLIGLVLLQRSEGGALGMGGGGGGALMSGRGAADALARMTSVAGGLFLVCSFLLTFIAQADRAGGSRSFMLSPPAQSAPATPQRESSAPLLAPAPAAAAPSQATTVPISAPAGAEVAPSPTDAQTRAGPVAAARPAATPAPAATRPAAAPATTAQRTTPAPAATRPAAESRPRTTAVTQPLPESVDAPPSEPTRRERAGPDQ